jgi:hypothetical protein
MSFEVTEELACIAGKAVELVCGKKNLTGMS